MITLEENILKDLLKFTQTDDKTLAVRTAVEDYVRREKLKALAAHMGLSRDTE